MKNIFILLVAALALIFILNVRNTYQSFSRMENITVAFDTTVQAFDPALITVPGFKEIEDKMSGMIKGYKKTEHNCSLWNIIFNLLVTILTGLTALITSISTIKNSAVSKAAGIRIAVITFTAAILSFGQSQITSGKETAQKYKEKVITIRDELEALKPDELINQISKFNRRLDEEFN